MILAFQWVKAGTSTQGHDRIQRYIHKRLFFFVAYTRATNISCHIYKVDIEGH